MKLSTTKENLSFGLSSVSRVSSRNVNLPILQNVLVKADSGILKLSGTNLEIAVSSTVRGKIEKPGDITVPARLFADYIGLLPAGQVDLERVGNALVIRSPKSETKLNGIPASEFPVIPRVTEGKKYFLNADKLQQALGSVAFAVAQTEARPELTGVLFSFNKGQTGRLILAATDSYRLGEASLGLGNESDKTTASVIVPGRAVVEFLRVLGAPGDGVEERGIITVTVSDNQIQFEIGGVELQSRVIEGSYPDYRQIIPEHFETTATLSKTEFAAAVKAASLFAKTGLNDVRLEFAPKKPVVVKSANTQTGEFRTEVSAEVSGAQNHVVLNFKYFLDGLGALLDDEVQFKLIDASNPCLLIPKDAAEKYLYIVMPIKQ